MSVFPVPECCIAGLEMLEKSCRLVFSANQTIVRQNAEKLAGLANENTADCSGKRYSTDFCRAGRLAMADAARLCARAVGGSASTQRPFPIGGSAEHPHAGISQTGL